MKNTQRRQTSSTKEIQEHQHNKAVPKHTQKRSTAQENDSHSDESVYGSSNNSNSDISMMYGTRNQSNTSAMSAEGHATSTSNTQTDSSKKTLEATQQFSDEESYSDDHDEGEINEKGSRREYIRKPFTVSDNEVDTKKNNAMSNTSIEKKNIVQHIEKAIHKPIQLRDKLHSARGVLKQVQKDYMQCSKLSEEYRQKHRQQMEIYLTMNKLFFLWQKGSSSDNQLSSELLHIVKNANILPDDELSALRRANDQVMKEVYKETSRIDKEYFSPDNPIFQDLTDAQQREFMENKHLAHSLLRKRLSAMNVLKTAGSDDKRYRIAFSNTYFGEKKDLVNTAWGTDDLILNNEDMMSQFRNVMQHMCVSSNVELKLMNGNIVNIIQDEDNEEISKGLQKVYDELTHDDSINVDTNSYTSEYVLQWMNNADRGEATEPQQITDVQFLVKEQPIFQLKENDNEEERFTSWREHARNLFDKELDVMYKHISFEKEGPYYLALQNSTPEHTIVVYKKNNTVQRVPAIHDIDATGHMVMSRYMLNDETLLNLHMYSLHDDYKDSGVSSIVSLYAPIACHVPTRVDVLYQLMWGVCVQTGTCYPVVPSLHFVAGIDSEQLSTDELVYWYNKNDLIEHLKNTQVELSHPDYDHLHIKGDFMDLQDDEESLMLWREYLARDSRATVRVCDMCADMPSSEERTSSSAIADKWWDDMKLNVGCVAHGNTDVKTYLNEYCGRLFLAIVHHFDDSTDGGGDWLDVTIVDDKHMYDENVDIIDAGYHEKIHSCDMDALYQKFGPLLIALYTQLGKLRISPFSESIRSMTPRDIFDDIRNALDMQMELLEHIVVNGKKEKDALYTASFFERFNNDSASNNQLLFCWRTFKNVFGVIQLHPWQRDIDPASTARYLKQTLSLDVLDSIGTVEPRVYLDMLDIVHDRAYGNVSEDGRTIVSVSQVHLLRFMLWNIGIWNMKLHDSGYAKVAERHLDELISDGNHPFADELTVEDMVYGHVSPLLLARMFVICARFANLPKDARERNVSLFKGAYDTIVTKIRHPVFLAMLLKFRGHFLQHFEVNYLHKLWQFMDCGLWEQDQYLWSHLLEYALAVELVGNASFYRGVEYFKELEYIMSVSEKISILPNDAILRVREKLKDTFVQ